MKLPTLTEIEAAAEIVYRTLQPTPQINWPLLSKRCGAEVWVKHENHLPTGAFKIRGGLYAMSRIAALSPKPSGVISATRGNHGQSVALAAAQYDLPVVIVVPHGNNPEKNEAMRALGAELIEHGQDFQDSLEHAGALAEERSLLFVRSYYRDLVVGVASYGLELFRACPDLDDVIVAVGTGSGLSGVIAARNALGATANIYGVVAEQAPAYALSFQQKQSVATKSADTLADGLACRTPDESALAILLGGAEDIFTVSETEILQAMKVLMVDTHNLAEGAGAASLAALLKEKDRFAGRKVAIVLSGGNADQAVLSRAMALDF
ncbi:MAG: threonine dehydratase [Rhodospirillaceae bacterium]|nr:threonine dehydratase [Rhodospirillaceae bacterium]MBT6089512.1 threonine dehydratase [Rhodospirillaceae bacterium]